MTALNVPPSQPIPPLEPGDHLTRAEFERRYRAMPHVKKAELIEGVVHMPSPVRWRNHSFPHVHVNAWLSAYWARTPGVVPGDNPSLRLDLENEPQPDATLLILPTYGGRVRISADDYVEGAPEWVGEVAASSSSFDLHTKLRVYRRNQVQEYFVWRVLDQAIDWFVYREGQYEPLGPGADGILRSEAFPGLWLDPAAMAAFDLTRVLAVLQEGLKSPDHSAFVTRLEQAASAQP